MPGRNALLEGVCTSENPLYAKIILYSESGCPAGVDSATYSLQTVTYEHHEIHEGDHFELCDYSSTLGLNELYYLFLTTNNSSIWNHMTFKFEFTQGGKLDLYESVTSFTGGSSQLIINNNRNSTKTALMTIYKNPSSYIGGSRISGHYAGAARQQGNESRDNEIILKQNTIYMFLFTSLAATNVLDYCFEWYQHSNKA